MSTIPGNYWKMLKKHGIQAEIFSRLRGNADSEFNNRNHRKITVIDGKVGYTGGVNLADEYINETVRFGHWKDTALRIEGKAVWELTYLFLCDFGISVKKMPPIREDIYPDCPDFDEDCGYMIPFGDGPRPIYSRNVGKSVIENILYHANEYVYLTSPYLIIDNDLCCAIENTALRGVDVRIIVPHIPDKKMVFTMTRSFYPRLIAAGVKIYEYTPGFIHAKSYVADGKYAMIGTINLDYRSLVHHFENGVWLYRAPCIADLERDLKETLEKSQEITQDQLKTGILTRVIRALVRVFAPML
jgi:cardiolipin synthase